MDIASAVAKNRRELNALKSTQQSSLNSIDKFVVSTTYTATGAGSGVFGKAGRILFVYLNTNFNAQPLAILNIKIVSDNRAAIAGDTTTYGFYNNILCEEMVSQSVGQVGWRITTPWIPASLGQSATLTLNIQVISNLQGQIQVVDGGYRYL